jgi:2-polyprenyl-3-methyl-5-hydroxy-6-metoxy-1,4-benzoquinol methylase
MLKYIPQSAKLVLEIGCGSGKFAALLRQRNQCELWAIEPNNIAAQLARKHVDKIFNTSIEEAQKYLNGQKFDVIILLDVIEHLVNPDQILTMLRLNLTSAGFIVASIPNMRYFYSFRDLVLYGKWDYVEAGILDRSHLRFFTYNSVQKFFTNLGFKIITIEGINPTSSFKLNMINLLFFNKFWDCKYLQFACVLQVKDDSLERCEND